jgi:anti-sigma regulatory factor (Ser/Thr protein kinase)
MARQQLREFLTEPGPSDPFAITAAVVISELVTNAVVHGKAPIQVSLGWDGACLRIEVFDHDPRASRIQARPATKSGESGHGLRIVAAVAEHWGVRGTDEGKSVWVDLAPELDTPRDRRRPADQT